MGLRVKLRETGGMLHTLTQIFKPEEEQPLDEEINDDEEDADED